MATEQPYASLAELKSAIDKSGTSEDGLLLTLLKSASTVIDRACNRPRGFVSDSANSARLYTGKGIAYIYIDECTSISEVAVKDSPTDSTYTAWETTDWISFSGSWKNPNYNDTPYSGLIVDPSGSYSTFTSGAFRTAKGFRPDPHPLKNVPTVQVTAKWGFATAVPDPIKQATLILASRWYKRGQSSWADSLATGDFGELTYVQALDPDVKLMLLQGRYKRVVIA